MICLLMVRRVIMRYWSRTCPPTIEESKGELHRLFILEKLDAETRKEGIATFIQRWRKYDLTELKSFIKYFIYPRYIKVALGGLQL